MRKKSFMGIEIVKRVYTKTIECCVECPAHICMERKCRCKELDRIVPEVDLVGLSYPKFCPLKRKK